MWNLDLIGASAAYLRGYTGAGILVTVADTGFDTTNAGLVNKLRMDLARSFVAVNGVPFNPLDVSPLPDKEKAGHATHVAGTIAAEKFDNTGLYMHGVAYDATIVPIRMLTDKYSDYAPGVTNASASALNYFASLPGTMIYNASYGPSIDPAVPPLKVWEVYDRQRIEGEAARKVLEAGKIIVAANGNDRERHPDAGRNPSGLALLPFLSPRNVEAGVYEDYSGGLLDFSDLQRQRGQIIAVMAIRSNKEAADYSNLCGYTASWCVASPGGDMPKYYGVYSTFDGNTYKFLEGTSMAAPAVSGALAVLMQAFPSYNAQDLSRLLFSTTEDLGRPGLDLFFGQGLIRLDRAIEGPTSLAAGDDVDVVARDTRYWSMPLVTSGAFNKIGDGVLTISGRTTAMGEVVVEAGTLAVDGTLMLPGSKLNVQTGGTLAGFGTVIGHSEIAGTLSPGKMANIADLEASGQIAVGSPVGGNSAGTLTFGGNVTLLPSATTRIDIDGELYIPGGPGTYDKVIVSGAGYTFWASGTLMPVLRGSVGTPSDNTPHIGSRFDIVQAFNGARTAGVFNAVTRPDEGMPAKSRFDVIYGSALIALAVTPENFAEFAADANLGIASRTIADMLDRRRVAPSEMPSSSDKALFDALYGLPSEQAYAQGLYELTGPGQPAVMSAMAQTFQGFMGPIADRQNAHVLNGSAGMVGTAQSFVMSYDGRIVNAGTSNAFASLDQPKAEQGWTVWGQGFGRLSTVNASGDLAGSRTTSTGFVMGADRIVSASLLAGGAFGFARTTASAAGTTGSSDTYAGAAYATWTPGAAKLDLRVAAGPSQISTSRQTILAPGAIGAAVNGFGTAVNLEAGYLIPVWQQAVLQPFAGLGWQGFRRGAYVESEQALGLAYGAQFYDKLTTTLGLSLSAQLRTMEGATVMPELRIGWGHDLRDTTLVTQAALLDTPFTVESARPGRDAGLVGFKLSGWRSENFRLYGSYNGEFRSNAISHQVTAGARFSW